MRKRLLAIIATAAMVVAMVPSMVAADSYVAKVGNVEYTSVNEAILNANNGDTVYLYGTISEAINPYAGDSQHVKDVKSITIDGGGSAVVTGGMYIGYDDSKTRNNTITVKGVTFEGKGLTIMDELNAVVKDNTFKNITVGSAIAVCDMNKGGATGSAVIENNNIDGVAGGQHGIRVRNAHSATIKNNVIKNIGHNGILVEGSCTGDLTISNNQIVNWDSNNDSEGGRAIRAVVSANSITITDNKMVKDDLSATNTDQDFAKLSSVNPQATIKLDGNYWNSANPNLSEIITIEGQGVNAAGIIADVEISTEGIPAPAPTPTTPAKPDNSPNTGDNSMAPIAVAGLALAAMTAVVATRRRTN